MYHVSHIVVCVLICMTVLENGDTAKSQPLIEDFLSMLAGNVGSILAPNLSLELEKKISNRINSTTTIAPTTISKATTKSQLAESTLTSTVTSTTKKSKNTTTSTTTTAPLMKKLKLIGKLPETIPDSLRAPQTQLENQYPFDFRNNYQNYPGIGSLQGGGRQFNGGSFGGRDSFNPNIYRPFNSPLNSDTVGLNGGQGIDPRFPGRDSPFNGGNRPFNSLDPSSEFDRYQQNFGRHGFDGRFPGSNRFFDQQGFRGDGTNQFSNPIGQPSDDRNNLLSNNYRQDIPANYQNSIVNDQGQGQNCPSFLGSANPQQSYAQNSFDFLPSQRFQNPFDDGFQRNQQQQQQQQQPQPQQQQQQLQPQQRGPSFPVFFPASPNNDGASSLRNFNGENNDGIGPGPFSSAGRRFGSMDKALKINRKNTPLDATPPRIQQARDELANIFHPLQNDYSDIRSRPDAFKQTLVGSNIVAKPPINNSA